MLVHSFLAVVKDFPELTSEGRARFCAQLFARALGLFLLANRLPNSVDNDFFSLLTLLTCLRRLPALSSVGYPSQPPCGWQALFSKFLEKK
jgi:hypothetical protein